MMEKTMSFLIHVENYSIVRLSDGSVGYKMRPEGTRQHFVVFRSGVRMQRNYDEEVEVLLTPAQVTHAYLQNREEGER